MRTIRNTNQLCQTVIVDGTNVAYDEQDGQGRPQVKNIQAMIEVLKVVGFKDIITFVTPKLKYAVSGADRKTLRQLRNRQLIRETPIDSDDDKFIINTAKNLEGMIVSNDGFRNKKTVKQEWVRERRISYKIIHGTVIFEDLEEQRMQKTDDKHETEKRLAVVEKRWKIARRLQRVITKELGIRTKRISSNNVQRALDAHPVYGKKTTSNEQVKALLEDYNWRGLSNKKFWQGVRDTQYVYHLRQQILDMKKKTENS